MNKYEVIIFWSEADGAFIAEIPELKGCVAHGSTQSEALKEVNSLAKEWLLVAREKGWDIPVPKGRLLFA